MVVVVVDVVHPAGCPVVLFLFYCLFLWGLMCIISAFKSDKSVFLLCRHELHVGIQYNMFEQNLNSFELDLFSSMVG